MAKEGVRKIINRRKGHKEIVKLLIENGVDVNAQANDGGLTSLFVAVLEDHKEIVDLLRKHG